MKTNQFNPPKLLLVEDNPIDVDLIEECFEDARIYVNMKVAENGVVALDILKEFRPDIILLDLNMPKMDGREFLTNIKGNSDLKSIPVVVLTTSEAHEDILMSYNLQASAYLKKPVRYDDFLAMMKEFKDFYLTFVKLPRSEN